MFLKQFVGNLLICYLLVCCGAASAQTYQKLDKLDLRNTTSTANPSFRYSQNGVIYSKTSGGVETGFWNAQTGAVEFAKIVNTGATNVFEVGPGREYASISSAVSAATDDSVEKVIAVYPGRYNETTSLTVAKTHLVGMDRDGCVIGYHVTDLTAIVDVQASGCSVSNLTVLCTQTNGAYPYSRCVRVGDAESEDTVDGFWMSNCALFGSHADEVWIQDNVSSATVRNCYAEGTYDVFANSAGGAHATVWYGCSGKASNENSSLFWCGSLVGGGNTNTFIFGAKVLRGVFVTLANCTAVVDDIGSVGSSKLYQSGTSQTSSTIIYGTTSCDAGVVNDGAVNEVAFNAHLVVNPSDAALNANGHDTLTVNAQAGGNTENESNAGDGASVYIKAGNGGRCIDSADALPGDAGNVTITAGFGGTNNAIGDTGGNGGNVYIAAGSGAPDVTPGTDGKIYLRGDTDTTGTITTTAGFVGPGMAITGIPKLLFASTANATVSNTSAETNFSFTGVGSKVVSSGSEAVGQTYRITAHGIRHANTSSNQDAIFKIKLGSVTLAEFSGGTATTIVDGSTDPFSISALYTVRATGVSGSIAGGGTFEVVDTSGPVAYAISANTGGAATVNFTGNPEWHLSVDFDAADPNLDAAIYAFTVEQLN